MNKKLRKAVIAGNWKMNKTPAEAKELIDAIKPLVKNADCDVVVCVPYIDLLPLLKRRKARNIRSARKTATGKKAALSPAKFLQTC